MINKTVYNLQRENQFLNFNAWKDKLVKLVVVTHKKCLQNERDRCYLWVVNILPITLRIAYTIPWFLDKHKQDFPKIRIFSLHTLNMFLLSSLIYVDCNLVFGGGNTTWYQGISFLKGNCCCFFFLKVLLKYAKTGKGMLTYKTYFRMGSMLFSLFRCHIGNDITQSHSV